MRRPNRHRKKTLVDAATSDEEDDVDVKIFRNHVYLWSDITKKSSLDLILGLQKLHCSARSSTFRDDDSPIYIHINSNGGDVDAALGVADTMWSEYCNNRRRNGGISSHVDFMRWDHAKNKTQCNHENPQFQYNRGRKKE